jgi:glycosyltransferase involved in cell wall biosynthesis
MYNAEHSIECCLNSVLTQSYPGLIEVVVVNDGSKDNSSAVVQGIMDRNQKSNTTITLIEQLNGGVSKARNVGLSASRGEFIAFLDADDEWLPAKLEKQISLFINNTDVDLLATNFTDDFMFPPAERLIRITLSKLIFKNYFQPSTVVMRRSVFKSVGFFDESQKYAEEGNYFMRIARNFGCYLLNEKLIVYGQGKAGFGETGLSANLKQMEIGELKNLRFAYHQNYINMFTYIGAVTFSVLKYFRRIIIVKSRSNA